MNSIGIFLLEPEINPKYFLMFTKKFPFIKIFGKEVLWWTIKNALFNNKANNYDIYVYISSYNNNDIDLIIEKISEGNYNVVNNNKFFCKNINSTITFIFDLNLFNKIKNNYEKDYHEYKIGEIQGNLNLNKIEDLNKFFLITQNAADNYFYLPPHEQQKLFKLYDKIV